MKKDKPNKKKKLNLFSYDNIPLNNNEKYLLKKKGINFFEKPSKNKKELIENLSKFTKKNKINAILTRLGIEFNHEIYKFLSKPKILLSYTTGLNHVLIDRRMKDLKIFNLERSDIDLRNVPSTAEFTIGLILNLIRKINIAISDTKNGYWRRELFIGRQLKDLKIGIIGCGRIGSQVSKYCKAFNAKVYSYDILKKKKNISLQYILRNSDVISLHLNYKKNLKGFFNKKKFNLMKKNSYFINTSRGELVNENDLISAIKEKNILGAAIDVLNKDSISEKKITTKSMLKIIKFSKSNENLIVTPHLGGATLDAMKTTRGIVIEKLFKYFKKYQS